MRISDWSSDVCSSDLGGRAFERAHRMPGAGADLGARRVHGVGRQRVAADLVPVFFPAVDFLGGLVLGSGGCRRQQQDASQSRDHCLHRSVPPAGRSVRSAAMARPRSEAHTSELQSLMRISYSVFCLKNKNTTKNNI